VRTASGLVIETVGIFPEMAGVAADRKGGRPPTQALPHQGRHEDLRKPVE
jgi:hypothetical protein